MKFSEAESRWAGLGPYYAMFPFSFAKDVVAKYSDKGSTVLDPFAGRGSSIFAASIAGRLGVGIEINPVGWLYGRTKLRPANQEDVLDILEKVIEKSRTKKHSRDEFFKRCYSQEVYDFLMTARAVLDWKRKAADATLMSIILVYLHGKIPQALSNQMRQGKALSPEYSIKWWIENGFAPPSIDVSNFLKKRIKWRYAKGQMNDRNSKILLGDSTKLIKSLATRIEQKSGLLFTSPPYYDVTNYHYDQWLRLWMLGGPNRPEPMESRWAGKFSSKENYLELLENVFESSAKVMKKNAVVYVRTDARTFTFESTKKVLKEVFPQKKMKVMARPFSKPTQTALFGDKTEKPGEMDLILTN